MFVQVLWSLFELRIHSVTKFMNQSPFLHVHWIARSQIDWSIAAAGKTDSLVDNRFDLCLREFEAGDLLHPLDHPLPLIRPNPAIFFSGVSKLGILRSESDAEFFILGIRASTKGQYNQQKFSHQSCSLLDVFGSVPN